MPGFGITSTGISKPDYELSFCYCLRHHSGTICALRFFVLSPVGGRARLFFVCLILFSLLSLPDHFRLGDFTFLSSLGFDFFGHHTNGGHRG